MNDPHRAERFLPEDGSGTRTPFQLDRGRILYSTSFARLAEITQVVRADHGHVFHNRLTHSLKVGQLARRMAELLLQRQPDAAVDLGGLDPDVAEAAGLAHDLGHPPFGHAAEKELNDLATNEGVDGFEGNAQTFRILTRLAVSDAFDAKGRSLEGTNATRATLNAVLKYPWIRGDNPDKPEKWGAYSAERARFEWVRQHQPFHPNGKSIEAELMDWAEDITFATHDLIDFYCSGHVPLERLTDLGGDKVQAFKEGLSQYRPDLDASRFRNLMDALESLVPFFAPLKNRYSGMIGEQRLLWRFGTSLISRYVEAIRLSTPSAASPVVIAQYARDEVEVLKELTWHYVIRRHDLAAEQHGHVRIIGTLFDILLRAAGTKSSSCTQPERSPLGRCFRPMAAIDWKPPEARRKH